jgi:phosphoglycerol geranylgeranyltransferase
MKVYNYIRKTIEEKGAAYLILLDPDKLPINKAKSFLRHCERTGIDGFLIGGSLMISGNFESLIEQVKVNTNLPAIIFPGSIDQVSSTADAILFLSVVSGRNADHLIGRHVIASPMIKQSGIEPISTAYVLIESGVTTTAVYMSGSMPLPRNKPEIAAATALAAEYLGMKLIYLEAGSGADQTVPDEMITAVAKTCTVPIIVGGGIRSPLVAREKVESGANIIVTGNYFEDEDNWDTLREFANAVHFKSPIEV